MKIITAAPIPKVKENSLVFQNAVFKFPITHERIAIKLNDNVLDVHLYCDNGHDIWEDFGVHLFSVLLEKEEIEQYQAYRQRKNQERGVSLDTPLPNRWCFAIESIYRLPKGDQGFLVEEWVKNQLNTMFC